MAEAELAKLRRLPENRRCATCKHEDRLGFNAICVKFQIFVCGDCKSAHQAFSHRCKSVTMSNWNKDEVRALTGAAGGGNVANMAKYFAKLPADSPQWPVKGCHPNDLKEFVRIAYEEKRWYSDVPSPGPTGSATPPPGNATPAEPATLYSASAPGSYAGGMDLLGGDSITVDRSAGVSGGGFSAFEAAGTPDAWASFSAAPAPSAAASGGADSWQTFSSAPPPAPSPPKRASSSRDGWASFSAAPSGGIPPASPGSAFDDFVSAAPAGTASAPPLRKSFTAPSGACVASAGSGA